MTRKKAAFLPDGSVAFLERRAQEVGGLSLCLLGVALALALASYDASDPSLNTASDGRIGNLLGYPGAVLADIFMQSFGLPAFGVAGAFLVWGGLLARHRPFGAPAVQVCALLFSVIFLSAAASVVPPPGQWPSAAGLGGSVGQLLMLHVTGLLAGLVPGDAPIIAALAFGAVGAVLFGACLGVSVLGWRNLLAHSVRGTLQAIIWWVVAIGRWVRGSLRLAARGVAMLGKPTLAFGALLRALRTQRTTPEPEPVPGHVDTAGRIEPTLGAGPGEPSLFDAEEPDEAEPEPEAQAKPKAPRRRSRVAKVLQNSFDLLGGDGYQAPPLELLAVPTEAPARRTFRQDGSSQNARLLESVLEEFGVRGNITKVRPGPVVTLYELEPAPGTKSSRVIGLADDIARSMSAISVRVAVVPGRNAIGIELPNAQRETVYLRQLLAESAYVRSGAKLPLVLGKDIGGAPIIADLARMPHLLIAGTTGSGKSVGINAMILSLLYKLGPDQCRFIMVDPKMLELSVYNDIPHLLSPVVTDPKKAVVALKWTVREMEDRYRAMSKLGVRNIESFNKRLADAQERGEVLMRKVQTGFDPDTGKPIFEDQTLDLVPLPYIVVVVDEMADLMLVAGKDIEAAVQRLAQMARAAGIHLIMATQRPSVDVITGTIKANFPTRISFQVTSKIDSRTILGEQGAEQLLGMGDMLHMSGGGRINRVHGPFVTDGEVEDVVRHLHRLGEPAYVDAVTEDVESADDFGVATNGESGDALFDQAVALVAREGKASTSFIQRHLQIGYNRAARLIERMEAEGMVSPANHVGRREVLLKKTE